MKMMEASAMEEVDLSINFLKAVKNHNSSEVVYTWCDRREGAGKMTVGCKVIIYILGVIKLQLYLP